MKLLKKVPGFFSWYGGGGPTFYVDSAATGTGDGSSKTDAWTTLGAITGLAPGDTVLLKRGTSYAESLAPSASGSETSPITYDAYGVGDKPVVQPLSSGGVTASTTKYDFLTFKNIDADGSLSSGNNGFVIGKGCTNWVIDSCVMRNWNQNGVQISDTGGAIASGITIKNCAIHDNTLVGIYVARENNGITITKNTIYANGVGQSGNVGGLHIVDDTGSNRPDDLTVTDNVIYENKFGAYLDTLGTGAVISGNTFHSNTNDGMVLEWTTGASVHNNLSYNNDIHGFAIIRLNKSCNIDNNTSYGNGQGGSSGADFSINVASPTAGGVTDNNFRNNIAAGGAFNQWVVTGGYDNDQTNGDGNVFENNLIFGSILLTGVTRTVTEFESITNGLEAGTASGNISDNPLFVSPETDDFRLFSNSPAVNAGADVGLGDATPNMGSQEGVSGNSGVETVTTGSPTLTAYGLTNLDSNGGAVTATQPDGTSIGQEKVIILTDATTSSTVTVTNHITSPGEVFTFTDLNDYLILKWMGVVF